jgi:phosphoglycerate dehydrogenase-like enzyme
MTATLALTFDPPPAARAAIADALDGAAEIVCIAGLDAAARTAALSAARVVLARNPFRELSAEERALLAGADLVQLVPAGIDFMPIGDLPAGVKVASNAGAYSEPMAEHAVAMILAAAKRLLSEHAEMARGAFNQQTANRMVAGMTCGILGFGAIGRACARLLRAFGARIHAINRGGRSDAPVDWIGTTRDLGAMLPVCDVLVIAAPLTRATHGLIGARELAAMKPDAILVNLARGEIVDEAALFAHLQANRAFTACIDAWWVEPVRHGEFRMDKPFMTLPNVIASPHNSASVSETIVVALRSAAQNCRRALRGEPVLNLVGPEDRYL